MLLRHEVADGVAVLAVRGPVEGSDAGRLLAAVEQALSLEPRGVVLDLVQAEAMSEGAAAVLSELAALPSGWPMASLVVCPPAICPDWPGLVVAPDRAQALLHLDDRSGRERTRVALPHGPHGPAQARAAVAACSARLGLEEMSDDVALVVSEMVTNAVRHAEPPVDLEIEVGDGEVVVAVRDGSPDRPVSREAGADAEGGRGMLLVDLLADDHGVRPEPPGKTVWARLRHPSRRA